MGVELRIVTSKGVEEIDIDQNQSLVVRYAIKDFSTIAGKKNNLSYFSYDFTILDTPKTRTVLKNAASVNSFSELVGVEVKAFLEKDNFAQLGFVKISDFEVLNNQVTYKANFKAGLINWLAKLPIYLNQLDLGTFEFNHANVLANAQDSEPYSGGTPFWNALKFYGNYEETHYVKTEEMYPDVYAKAIIDALGKTAKVHIQSVYLNTEYFRRQIHLYTGTGKFSHIMLKSDISGTYSTGQPIRTYNDTFDPLELRQQSLIIPEVNDSILILSTTNYFEVRLSIDASSSGVSYIGISNAVNNAGIEFYDIQQLQNGKNEIILKAQDFDRVDENRFFQIYIIGEDVTISGNMEVAYSMNLKEDVILENGSILPEKKITDWISGLTDTANLIWFYDPQKDNLIVEPKFSAKLRTGEVVNGFYDNIDLENMELLCETQSGSFKAGNVKRNLVFQFAEDTNDSLYNEVVGRHIEKLNTRYEEGDEPLTNEVFAYTQNRLMPRSYSINLPADEIPNIPFLVNFEKTLFNDNGMLLSFDNLTEDQEVELLKKQPTDYEMRLAYKVGLVAGSWRFNLPSGNNFRNYDEYPFATQFSKVHNVNLGYNDREGLKGIVGTFYQKDITIYNTGIRKTGQIIYDKPLSLTDLFRRMKFVDGGITGKGIFIIEALELSLDDGSVSSVELIG